MTKGLVVITSLGSPRMTVGTKSAVGEKTGGGDMRDELEGMFVHADVVFDKVHILYLAWLWIHPMSISHLFLDKNLQL